METTSVAFFMEHAAEIKNAVQNRTFDISGFKDLGSPAQMQCAQMYIDVKQSYAKIRRGLIDEKAKLDDKYCNSRLTGAEEVRLWTLQENDTEELAIQKAWSEFEKKCSGSASVSGQEQAASPGR